MCVHVKLNRHHSTSLIWCSDLIQRNLILTHISVSHQFFLFFSFRTTRLGTQQKTRKTVIIYVAKKYNTHILVAFWLLFIHIINLIWSIFKKKFCICLVFFRFRDQKVCVLRDCVAYFCFEWKKNENRTNTITISKKLNDWSELKFRCAI